MSDYRIFGNSVFSVAEGHKVPDFDLIVPKTYKHAVNATLKHWKANLKFFKCKDVTDVDIVFAEEHSLICGESGIGLCIYNTYVDEPICGTKCLRIGEPSITSLCCKEFYAVWDILHKSGDTNVGNVNLDRKKLIKLTEKLIKMIEKLQEKEK